MSSSYEDHRTGGKWSSVEDQTLTHNIRLYGTNWNKISESLPRRTPKMCQNRWELHLKSGLNKGPWSEDEDRIIIDLVNQGEVKWSNIAKLLINRNGKQCRERWYNHLDPQLKKTPWTTEEDEMLIAIQTKLGNSWTKIAQEIPGRSENEVKNRWYSAVIKRKLSSLKNNSILPSSNHDADLQNNNANNNANTNTNLTISSLSTDSYENNNSNSNNNNNNNNDNLRMNDKDTYKDTNKDVDKDVSPSLSTCLPTVKNIRISLSDDEILCLQIGCEYIKKILTSSHPHPRPHSNSSSSSSSNLDVHFHSNFDRLKETKHLSTHIFRSNDSEKTTSHTDDPSNSSTTHRIENRSINRNLNRNRNRNNDINMNKSLSTIGIYSSNIDHDTIYDISNKHDSNKIDFQSHSTLKNKTYDKIGPKFPKISIDTRNYRSSSHSSSDISLISKIQINSIDSLSSFTKYGDHNNSYKDTIQSAPLTPSISPGDSIPIPLWKKHRSHGNDHPSTNNKSIPSFDVRSPIPYSPLLDTHRKDSQQSEVLHDYLGNNELLLTRDDLSPTSLSTIPTWDTIISPHMSDTSTVENTISHSPSLSFASFRIPISKNHDQLSKDIQNYQNHHHIHQRLSNNTTATDMYSMKQDNDTGCRNSGHLTENMNHTTVSTSIGLNAEDLDAIAIGWTTDSTPSSDLRLDQQMLRKKENNDSNHPRHHTLPDDQNNQNDQMKE